MLEDQSALDEIVDYVSQYELRRTAFKVTILKQRFHGKWNLWNFSRGPIFRGKRRRRSPSIWWLHRKFQNSSSTNSTLAKSGLVELHQRNIKRIPEKLE